MIQILLRRLSIGVFYCLRSHQLRQRRKGMPSALWGPEKALKNIPKVEKMPTNTKSKAQHPRKSWKPCGPFSNSLLSAINSSTWDLNVFTCRKGQGCWAASQGNHELVCSRWGLDQARRAKSSAKAQEKQIFCVWEKTTRHKTYYIFPCLEEPRTSDEVP